jgi:hypothetical protein
MPGSSRWARTRRARRAQASSPPGRARRRPRRAPRPPPRVRPRRRFARRFIHLYSRVTKGFGSSIPETTMRPNPMLPPPRHRSRQTSGSCPGRKPPFLDFKRPARPYKTATQTRFTMGNARPLKRPGRAWTRSGWRCARRRARPRPDPTSGSSRCRRRSCAAAGTSLSRSTHAIAEKATAPYGWAVEESRGAEGGPGRGAHRIQPVREVADV